MLEEDGRPYGKSGWGVCYILTRRHGGRKKKKRAHAPPHSIWRGAHRLLATSTEKWRLGAGAYLWLSCRQDDKNIIVYRFRGVCGSHRLFLFFSSIPLFILRLFASSAVGAYCLYVSLATAAFSAGRQAATSMKTYRHRLLSRVGIS